MIPKKEKESSARTKFIYKSGPFIQFGPFKERHADASGSIIIWFIDYKKREGGINIKFGEKPLPEMMKSQPEIPGKKKKRHEFLLTDLKPLTKYYFQIKDFSEKIYSFKTGPKTGSNEPFRFLCVADTGNTRRGGYAHSYYSDTLIAADKFYKKINDLPAFKLHIGDIVKRGTDLDGWRIYFDAEEEYCSSYPCMLTIGNHEFLNDYGGNFYYFFAQPGYYSFDYGNVHFLSINPFDGPGKSADGPVLSTGKEQYRFIKEDLKKNSGKKWIIVTIHIPILSTGDYNINEILVEQYLELFRKYKVDMVISGHDHNFDAFHLDQKALGRNTLYRKRNRRFKV